MSCIWILEKCCLQNISHFVEASMCQSICHIYSNNVHVVTNVFLSQMQIQIRIDYCLLIQRMRFFQVVEAEWMQTCFFSVSVAICKTVVSPLLMPGHRNHIDGSVQDCINSSALAMELMQSCSKPSICPLSLAKNEDVQISLKQYCVVLLSLELHSCRFCVADEVDVLGYGSSTSDTDDHSSINSNSSDGGCTVSTRRLNISDTLWLTSDPPLVARSGATRPLAVGRRGTFV